MNIKKIVRRGLGVLVLVFLVLVLGVSAVFSHEIKTVLSVEKVDDYPLYTMDYDGDYGMDKFLAQGGASSDQELIDFVVKNLLKGLPIKIDLPDLACSTFNATTPEGDAVFGRNFDLEYAPGMLVRTDPGDGYASLSMVNLAFIGYGKEKLPDGLADRVVSLAAPFVPLDGVNEKGLAVGVLLIDTEATNQQSKRVDITTTTAIRMMLDTCATVEEAVELLSRYDMHASGNRSYHFQIADASGASVVVEYIGDKMNVVEQGPEGYQAATNFLLTPGDYDFGKGQDRYQTVMDRLVERKGVFTEEEAMDTLKSVSREVKINEKGEEFRTQWSVVYNQDRGTAKIAVGGDYGRVYDFALRE